MPDARPNLPPLRQPAVTRAGGHHAADQMVLNLFDSLGRFRDTIDALYAPAGLNEHKFYVLSSLAAVAPTPSVASELARLVGITRSSMTDVLDDLEGRGWIERRRDSADRRLIRVSLTATGEAVLRSSQQHFATVCEELLRDMKPAERARFAQICATIDRATHELRQRMPVFHPSAPSP
ncbi:MAG TPA: MarR family transcriptional regulator [Opitutaceae bacterium]